MSKKNKIIFSFKPGIVKVRRKAVPLTKIIQPKKGGIYKRNTENGDDYIEEI